MAATKIKNELKDLELKYTKKLFPKIMICNVSKEENKDEVTDYLF